MEPTRRGRRATSSTASRIRWIAVGIGALVVVAGIIAAVVGLSGALSSPTPSDASEPLLPNAPERPPSAVDALLRDAGPEACAVSFAGDSISGPPVLQTQGALFRALPIPSRDGAVFAGWYDTVEAAAGYEAADRVNGADAVTCTNRERTLYGAWKTADRAAAEKTRVPILMYHQFTDKPEGERNSLRLNYAYISDFDAHMKHISETGFYLPTWDELGAFIDGKLSLPERSVIVTDDDADSTWLSMAVPVVEKYRVLTTSFVITKWRSEPTPGTYVLQRSHTDSMHEAGANGKGRMVNWSAAEIAADLEKSAAILGAKEVVAYPFGHYNDTTKQGVREAGYEFGRTIEDGYVTRGTDKLALPVIRVDYGTTLADLVSRIG